MSPFGTAQTAPERADLDALAEACRLLGDRWSLPLIAALLEGPRRYGELQEQLAGIAPNILTARLRKLEEDGLVISSQYSERPPRFEYQLTPEATGLADAVRLLSAWAADRAHERDPETDGESRPTHAACGSALEVRWWCPTCDAAVSPDDDEPIMA
jgi:DNA-binding HxlR family transcriptional regulator